MGTVHAKEHSTMTYGEMDRNSAVTDKKTVNLQEIQARVDKVNVEGLNRTQEDIIKRTVKELFKVNNFEEVIKEVHRTQVKLESLGCFSNISALIDVSSGPKATSQGYEVTYFVKELKRVKGSVNTVIGRDNEGSRVVGTVAPNVFGRAEKLHCEFSYGSRQTSTFNVGFYKPFILNTLAELNTSVFQNESDWPNSGYKQIDRGTSIGLGFPFMQNIRHTVQWEGCWRELNMNTRYVSFDVREESGHTLKSAVKHILTVDTRNTPLMPTFGSLLQCTSEIAGLGGNIRFLKNEVLLQHNVEIFPETVIQGSVTGGVMRPLGSQKEIHICDKFFLGGPQSLRGFISRGVGPVADKNFIGGTLYWAGALHLYAPLPFKPGAGGIGDLFRTHLFVNAGNVGSFNIDFSDRRWLHEFRESTRLAYGAGLAIRLGQLARVEINYVIPVLFDKSDGINRGVQFGIGVHFL
ncbi:hypothetical protein LSTR_LSTR001670 [Laodelphax striatellus]|uniref:Bacterial surface antigen (D15) domain-containing protein n=1 Tax=Laodelphax striatellus TaxID=195883 RepID=A0A482XDA0_LAOST|nr:hypothetical protein LSTR_LSTR001670 [Laodelphax striatellus]